MVRDYLIRLADVPAEWSGQHQMLGLPAQYLPIRTESLAKRLRGFPEVSDLCIEGAFEGGPRRAAVDISGEALVAGNDVGVLQNAQHRRHHEIASSEPVAIKIELVADRFG